MRNQIVPNKQFYILSRSIDNAEICDVIDVNEDCFKVKLLNPQKYEVDESIEMFTMTDKGQLYFETIVKDINEDIISVWFPIAFKYLQRREFSRVNLNKEISLTDSTGSINAKIIDISAGGLKIETKQQLELLKEYGLSLKIENQEVNTKFEPIRIETSLNGFISSGRFKDITNYDRIALVQYCFRKKIEISSK